MASFLYYSQCNYRSSNYRDSDSCHSFTILKALAKNNSNIFVIASKHDNYCNCYCNSWKSDNLRERDQENKQRTDTINEVKKIKSFNFTRGNREKSNIAIAIMEK